MARILLAVVLAFGGIVVGGCSEAKTGIEKPDEPAPLPDPADRVGSGGKGGQGQGQSMGLD